MPTLTIITVILPCSVAAVKRLLVLAINAVIISYVACVCVRSTLVHMASTEQLYFRQRLWVVTLVFMFWIDFWKSFAALQHCEFCHLIGNYSYKSITEEPLVGETRVRCNFTI